MLTNLIKDLKQGSILLLVLIGLTGLAYPLLITALAQLLFPVQANGSLIKQDNERIGSLLIGQSFTEPGYFWGRPSATQPFPYNALASCASNLGPSSQLLSANIKNRHQQLNNSNPVPIDLLTASGSGLDPEISLAAAYYQVPRVAKERGMDEAVLYDLVKKHLHVSRINLLGEPRVNVLKLNLAIISAEMNFHPG